MPPGRPRIGQVAMLLRSDDAVIAMTDAELGEFEAYAARSPGDDREGPLGQCHVHPPVYGFMTILMQPSFLSLNAL